MSLTWQVQQARPSSYLISGPSTVSSVDCGPDTYSADSNPVYYYMPTAASVSAIDDYTARQTARRLLDAPCDLPPSLAGLAISLAFSLNVSLYVQLYTWHDVMLTTTAHRQAADCAYSTSVFVVIVLFFTEPTLFSDDDATSTQCRYCWSACCPTDLYIYYSNRKLCLLTSSVL